MIETRTSLMCHAIGLLYGWLQLEWCHWWISLWVSLRCCRWLIWKQRW